MYIGKRRPATDCLVFLHQDTSTVYHAFQHHPFNPFNPFKECTTPIRSSYLDRTPLLALLTRLVPTRHLSSEASCMAQVHEGRWQCQMWTRLDFFWRRAWDSLSPDCERVSNYIFVCCCCFHVCWWFYDLVSLVKLIVLWWFRVGFEWILGCSFIPLRVRKTCLDISKGSLTETFAGASLASRLAAAAGQDALGCVVWNQEAHHHHC